jgi:hypothetical protein
MRIGRRSSYALSVLAGVVLVLSPGILRINAEEESSNYLPDAPVAPIGMPHAVLKGYAAAQPVAKKRRLSVNRLSFIFLAAGEAVDSWSTYSNLSHPKWICGYSPAFGDAATYVSNDGRHYDAQTIQKDLCGPGPSGEAANYAYDVTRNQAFIETGWAASFGLADKRNFWGVEAWNLANDAGQFLIASYVGRRWLPKGRLGSFVNLTRSAVHLECGILNIRFARRNSNPDKWQFRVPDETQLFPTPRWWGRR